MKCNLIYHTPLSTLDQIDHNSNRKHPVQEIIRVFSSWCDNWAKITRFKSRFGGLDCNHAWHTLPTISPKHLLHVYYFLSSIQNLTRWYLFRAYLYIIDRCDSRLPSESNAKRNDSINPISFLVRVLQKIYLSEFRSE